MKRKGMMVGKGKRGYHNVIPKDPKVHSQSAKGMKQPQRINELKTRIRALSKFKSPAFQEERELLKREYKELLNKDIDDYSKGIENIRIKRRMQEIEEKFNIEKDTPEQTVKIKWVDSDGRMKISRVPERISNDFQIGVFNHGGRIIYYYEDSK